MRLPVGAGIGGVARGSAKVLVTPAVEGNLAPAVCASDIELGLLLRAEVFH
jgi:hypothetical protein